jgi:NADH:ubiquinone oxidoreductase subunit 2 (subunit N)
MMPFALELGLAALILIVFVATLLARGDDRRWVGWLATIGVLALGLAAMIVPQTPAAMGGMFVQDGLALFAKRLFLAATFIGLLAGLGQPGAVFARRAGE